MKFYGRKEELTILEQAHERISENSQMTVVMGRRRIGKTRLILKSLEGHDFVYLFVSKKTERLLCADFLLQISEAFGEDIIGDVSSFQMVFKLLCQIAGKRSITVVFDEFQEFASINPSIYSDMQRDWDLNKSTMKMNMILCGSVQSMMNKIFLDAREPLFGRASGIIRMKPFGVSTLREIFRDYHPGFSADDLLALYTITGGVAQYVEWLMEGKAFSRDKMLTKFFSPQSVFLDEGKNALIQDLGKEYTIYFSVLSLIASGFTSRVRIESVLQITIGGHLQRLEKVYGIIKRRRPVFSKENSTAIRFYLADNFYRFWFRFVYKYQTMVEADNIKAIRTIVNRDYRTFAGLSLESMIRNQMKETQNYTRIGNYWERKNQQEIDIVAVNELEHRAVIAEVKWQRKRVNLAKLELKAEKLVRENLKGYEIEYRALGLEDVEI